MLPSGDTPRIAHKTHRFHEGSSWRYSVFFLVVNLLSG
jgi:hypothetical protein